jgi:hypothetical protein
MSVEVLVPIIVAVWGLALVMIMGLCASSASPERATRRQMLRAVPSLHGGRMRRPRRSHRARRGGLHAV